MEFFLEKDVEILERKKGYKSFIEVQELKLRHRLFSGEWSKELSRTLVNRKAAVGVLLYDAHQDRVVLINQFRVGALSEQNPWLMEIVAGMFEGDESPEKVAHRETQEETGSKIMQLIPIVEFYPSPGGSSEKIHLFCAQIDSAQLSEGVHGNASEDEDIFVYIMPRGRAYQMLQEGKIINSISIIALQWLQLNIDEVKAKFMRRDE